MLMACLSTGSHITFNLNDSLNGADEYGLELQQALRNGEFRLPGDEDAAMDLLLESRFPSWVGRSSSDNTWIGDAVVREGGRRIGQLACREDRIPKIIGNTELE
jgi:hypothetical protein